MTKVLVTEQNLQNIADSIRGKNGSAATYKPGQMSAAIDAIPTGGSTRPETWAEFAAMSSSALQKCYGVGDRVGIACPWRSPSNNTNYADLIWEIAGFGTTKKENDNTEYPCVSLVARLCTNGSYQFDAPETPTAATEETAQDGIYYFGYNGSTYTALNLSTGDTIPYGEYTAVYKTDATNNASYFDQIRQYGWNNYKYSAIRQWLNSDAAANNWWQASHIGDVAPNYTNQAGFMNGLDSGFKAILQRTEVVTAGNTVTDDGSNYSTYDYLFLPSNYETYVSSSPVEGDRQDLFAMGGAGKNGLRCRGPVDGGNTATFWLRSANRGNANFEYSINNRGSSNNSNANTAYSVAAACKIILAS